VAVWQALAALRAAYAAGRASVAMNCAVCGNVRVNEGASRDEGGDGLCSVCWGYCARWAKANGLPRDARPPGALRIVPPVTVDAWIEAGAPQVLEGNP
jgi:hypothetical protein